LLWIKILFINKTQRKIFINIITVVIREAYFDPIICAVKPAQVAPINGNSIIASNILV
jgi:hypothetical protein